MSHLDTKKMFSKLKSHVLSSKCHPNHDASFSKTFVTGTCAGGHVANPTTLLTDRLCSLPCPLWPQL
jgi:hypothetical protein